MSIGLAATVRTAARHLVVPARAWACASLLLVAIAAPAQGIGTPPLPAPAHPPALAVDIATISGVLGLRRFRHGTAWPLFTREQFNDDGSKREIVEVPLGPGGDQPEAFLMPAFCSDPMPEIVANPTHLGTHYVQVGGELGNCGLSTCVFGSIRRKFAPRYRDEHNTRGEFHTMVEAPVEHLLIDVIAHRDLVDEGLSLEAEVMQTSYTSAFLERQSTPLHCPERVRRLGPGKPRVATPLAPRYGEIVDLAYEQMGWEPGAFRGSRFEMKHPPLPSGVVLSYSLPEGP